MRKVTRLISILISAIMIISLLPLSTMAVGRIFDVNKMFEAEDGMRNNGLYTISDSNASGGKYFRTPSKETAVTDPNSIMLEDMSWRVRIPKDGKYYVYLLTRDQASFYARINDENWSKVSLEDDGSTLHWELVLEKELSEGINTVRMHHLNTGGWFDALYVTDDPSTLPEFKIEEEETVITGSEFKIISPQKNIPTLTSDGLVIELEDAEVSDKYTFASSKLASGLKGIKAVATSTKARGPGTQGHVQYYFKCQEAGTYAFWIRYHAEKTNQDSVYLGLNNLKYDYYELPICDGFAWKKCFSADLEAGEDCVFRIYAREAGAILDNVLITTKRFTPTGRTGNQPTGDNAKSSISAGFAKPPITPPDEHPRLLFRKSDIERIKANMVDPQNAVPASKFRGMISEPITGEINNSFDSNISAEIEAFAFDYAINGNVESGEIAVNALLNFLNGVSVDSSSSDSVTRNGGLVIYEAAEVYDWCYDLLSNAQKEKIISSCEAIADMMEIGWPPLLQGSVSGHGAEAQLLRCLLSFAIATYDERPDIWEVVAGRFYEEYVDPRNYLNKGHYAIQGDSYGLYRHQWDSWSHFVITGMGAPAPYITEDLYQVPYSYLYMRRPDGQILRDGDTSSDTANAMWTYWNDRSTTFLFDSAIGKDPYLKYEYARQFGGLGFNYDHSAIMYLIFNDPSVGLESTYNLPFSRYFPHPAGMSIARTGWADGVDSPVVVAEMKIGGFNVNGHQHLDAGHFQIYYKGILASDSGVYQGLDSATNYGTSHYNTYMTKSIAHNTMLVYDPSEGTVGVSDPGNAVDGGQRAPHQGRESAWSSLIADDEAIVSEVVGQEIDPTDPQKPAYTYLKGDLTKAYSSKKMGEFKRSFMFLNLFNEEVPAAMIVFDKVTSKNPSFKKTWLLHGLEEPEINGNQTIFKRTYHSAVYANGYNGKMTVDTLLPSKDNALITKIGGEEYGYSNINGVDYTGLPANTAIDEGSTWRMELSPKESSATDYFLNVIQVSDADKDYYLETKMIETPEIYGAQISDRVVTFSKSGNRISNQIKFTVPVSGTVHYTVCDAESGTWKVKTSDGEKLVYVTEDGGVIALIANGGSFEATFVGKEDTTEKTEQVLPQYDKVNNINLDIDGFFVYVPDDFKFVNESSMLSLNMYEKYFDMKYSVSDNILTATIGRNTITTAIGSYTAIKNGEEYTMSEPITVIGDKYFAPIKSFGELFDMEIDWEEWTKIVYIESPTRDYTLPSEGYAQYKGVTADSGAVDGGNVCENAIDGDYDSIWAALGKGRYIVLEFDKPYTIDSAEILFNPNASRNARFELQVSADGVTYESVYTGFGDGSLEKPTWELFKFAEPKTVKFVKFIANGSNISDWNAIKEIRFPTVAE